MITKYCHPFVHVVFIIVVVKNIICKEYHCGCKEYHCGCKEYGRIMCYSESVATAKNIATHEAVRLSK